MERPFAVIGISALCALIFSVFLDTAARIIMTILCAAVLVVLIFWKKKDAFRAYLRMSAALLTVLLAFFAYELKLRIEVNPVAALAGTTAQIEAKILDYPDDRGVFIYALEVEQLVVEDEVVDMGSFRTMMSTFMGFYCEPGDRIRTEVTFYAYSDGFGFSSKSSFASKGIFIPCYQKRSDTEVLRDTENSLGISFMKLRRTLIEHVRVMLPDEEAGLVQAMLLGDRNGLSEQTQTNFKKSGISHLLVVSGLHMSMISGLILGFLSLLRLPRRVRNPLAILVIVGFMLLSGLSVSVLRSGIMMLIFLVADLFGRESDSLNSLGVAVFAMCLSNPLIGGDVGFLLSVFATLGILVLSGPLQKILLKPLRRLPGWSRRLRGVAAGLATGIAASLFILPLQIYLYGNISLLAPFATVLMSLPCTAMMYMAVPALLLFSVPAFAFLAAPFTYLTGMLCRLILGLADWLARWTVFSLDTGNTYALLPLCGALCLVAVLILRKPRRLAKIMAPVLVAMMIVLCAVSYTIRYDGSAILAIPRQRSDSCVVLMKGKQAAVLSLDGFQTTAATGILRDRNIREVSSVFLQGDKPQAIKALLDMLEKYPVGCVYLPEDFYVDKQLAEALGDTRRVFYGDALQYEALQGVPVDVRRGTMRFTVHDRSVIVDTGGGDTGSCDILITNDAESRVNSPFTVLQTDDIIVPKREVSSQYIFTSDYPVISLDFFRDGTMAIRG